MRRVGRETFETKHDMLLWGGPQNQNWQPGVTCLLVICLIYSIIWLVFPIEDHRWKELMAHTHIASASAFSKSSADLIREKSTVCWSAGYGRSVVRKIPCKKKNPKGDEPSQVPPLISSKNRGSMFAFSFITLRHTYIHLCYCRSYASSTYNR
jgi:hypothetical protein